MERSRFTILTDHFAHPWIGNVANAIRKLAQRRLRLFEYEFDFFERRRVKHPAADALSRVGTNGLENSPVDYNIAVMSIAQNLPI